jgi:hypothetical protein
MIYREVVRKLARLGCREIPRRGSGAHRKWRNPAAIDQPLCQTTAAKI